MGQNNQKDQKGPKMTAAVMLVQNNQNNQKIWSSQISYTILKVRFFWDTLYINVWLLLNFKKFKGIHFHPVLNLLIYECYLLTLKLAMLFCSTKNQSVTGGEQDICTTRITGAHKNSFTSLCLDFIFWVTLLLINIFF